MNQSRILIDPTYLRTIFDGMVSGSLHKDNTSAIINLGKMALEMHHGDEWEQCALEHLSTHLLIQAMASKDATALKTLAYSTIHWNWQVQISNGFEWSKRMLNDMMLWAPKYDDDEVIECALNMVDLYHQEQNDAPRIMQLVAQNDMDTVLQRLNRTLNIQWAIDIKNSINVN